MVSIFFLIAYRSTLCFIRVMKPELNFFFHLFGLMNDWLSVILLSPAPPFLVTTIRIHRWFVCVTMVTVNRLLIAAQRVWRYPETPVR